MNTETIFVVGAGKGLGNGVAEKFAENDFRVVLLARSEAHLKEYAADFAAKGIEVDTQAADVADFAAFEQTFSKVVETYGTPDVLMTADGGDYSQAVTWYRTYERNLRWKNLGEVLGKGKTREAYQLGASI